MGYRIIVHGDEQKKILDLPIHTSPIVPKGEMIIVSWCEVDDCPPFICGGPHQVDEEERVT